MRRVGLGFERKALVALWGFVLFLKRAATVELVRDLWGEGEGRVGGDHEGSPRPLARPHLEALGRALRDPLCG